MELWGNYDSPDVRNIMIVFEKCNNETSEVRCKSEDEISQWMQQKYILVYLNQRKFVQHKFD